MKTVVGLLVPVLVRAAQFQLKEDASGASSAGGKAAQLTAVPEVNSDFLLVGSASETTKEAEEASAPTAEKSNANDWNLLVGPNKYVVHGSRTGIYEYLMSFFGFFSSPPLDSMQSVVVSEETLSGLMQVSNLESSDFDSSVINPASLDALLTDLKDVFSSIEKLKVFLRYDRKLYEKFLKRNLESIQAAVAHPEHMADLVMTLIYGKSFETLATVMSASKVSIGVESLVLGLLSTNLASIYDFLGNSAILQSPCLDWSYFGQKPENDVERFKLVIDFALESPFVLADASFVSRLLQDGADVGRNKFACVKVAAINCAVDSFNLLIAGKELAFEDAAEISKFAAKSRCDNIVLYFSQKYTGLPSEIPLDYYSTLRQRGDAQMMQALSSCPISLPSKKFKDFIQTSGAGDEEILSIIKRRSSKSSGSYLNFFKSIAHSNRRQLFADLVSDSEIIGKINATEMTQVLMVAIKSNCVEAVRSMSSLPAKRFDQDSFSAVDMLLAGNEEIIDLVSRFNLPWSLEKGQVNYSTNLINAKAWSVLTKYISYRHSAAIKNLPTVLKAAFEQNQVDFIRACLLNNVPFPKNLNLQSSSLTPEMRAVLSGKKLSTLASRMSLTSAELVKARLEHLWQLSMEALHANAKHSQNLNKMIFRLAQDNEIVLGTIFFQNICQHCFQFFIPNMSCTMKYFKRRHIRRISLRGGKVVRFSQLVPDVSYRCASNDLNDLIPVIKCLNCNFCTVFDTSPVSIVEPPKVIKTSITAPIAPAKKEALQKVLSSSSKATPSKKESLDLESFLQGFL